MPDVPAPVEIFTDAICPFAALSLRPWVDSVWDMAATKRSLHTPGAQWPSALLFHEPRARVLHHVPASRATWRYFRTRCYFEGNSKAVVAWLVGSQHGLETERVYTRRVLPAGIVRGVLDAVTQRDVAPLIRAGQSLPVSPSRLPDI
jgi:hypothetical protein